MKLADASNLTKLPLKVQTEKTLITLVLDPAEEEILSEHTTQFTLRSRPRDPDSAKYKVHCRILQGNETVRQLVMWRAQVQKVLHGLNLTDYADMVPIVESLLSGTPVILFQGGLEAMKQKRMDARIAAAPDHSPKTLKH